MTEPTKTPAPPTPEELQKAAEEDKKRAAVELQAAADSIARAVAFRLGRNAAVTWDGERPYVQIVGVPKRIAILSMTLEEDPLGRRSRRRPAGIIAEARAQLAALPSNG